MKTTVDTQPAGRADLGAPGTVAHVMSAPVFTVTPSTTYKHMVQLMSEHAVSALPVVDEQGVLVGIVSEADLLVKESRPERHRVLWTETGRERRMADKAEATVAAEVMTAHVLTVHVGMPLAHAARIMQQHSVKRLPVVDDDGALVGIVSRSDLLKPFLRPDADIRSDIVETVLPKWLLIDPTDIVVDVTDGAVTLTGTVERSSEVEVIDHVLPRLEGVVSLDNRLEFGFDDLSLKRQVIEARIR